MHHPPGKVAISIGGISMIPRKMGGQNDIVLPTSMGFNQQPWELVVRVFEANILWDESSG